MTDAAATTDSELDSTEDSAPAPATSVRYIIADMGSECSSDPGLMSHYSSIRLDRLLYPFTVFHYSTSCLSPKIQRFLNPRFGTAIRVQPTVTPLYIGDAMSPDVTSDETFPTLPDPANLDWTF